MEAEKFGTLTSTHPLPATLMASLTLLRIKRKRTDEPLDSLVVDLPKKKSRDISYGSRPGIFTYAETIHEKDFFEDDSSTRDLHQRITALSSAVPVESPKPPRKIISGRRSMLAPKAPTNLNDLARQQFNIVKNTVNASSSRGSPIISRPSGLVSQDSDVSETPAAETNVSGFTLYDGIHLPPTGVNVFVDSEDPEMDVFRSMVSDYLSLNDVAPRPSPSNIAAPIPTQVVATEQTHDMEVDREGDYVYDVFYFRKRDKEAPDSMDVDGNVGLVMVRPEDDVEFLASSDDEDDSEVEDEDDPDSNDEDNPRNEYPDASDSDGSDWQDNRSVDYDDDSDY